MSDNEKLFICYYRSWWNFNIWPRKFTGWLVLLVWSLPAFVLFFGCNHLTRLYTSSAGKWAVAIGLVVLLLLWQWAMIRWMKARAVMVKVD